MTRHVVKETTWYPEGTSPNDWNTTRKEVWLEAYCAAIKGNATNKMAKTVAAEAVRAFVEFFGEDEDRPSDSEV